jgi:hypothetical protein
MFACATALAHGHRGHHRQPATFTGSCQFSGLLRQSPGATNLPQAAEATARARGTCSGTLKDGRGHTRQVDARRSRYFARAAGTVSCGGGSANGSGFVKIGRERIDFAFSELRGPGFAAIQLDGAAGGSAAGEARVSEEEDPVAIAQKCGGEGLTEARINIDVATTPEVSG